MAYRGTFPVLCITLVTAVLIASAAAQFGSTPFGSSGIVAGSVLGADNHPLNNARVEVRDLRTGTILSAAYTHVNGSFELYNIPAGEYEVTAVSGLFEARERVEVGEVQSFVTLRVAQVAANTTGKDTVSVAELKIPDNARKQVEKARKALEKNNHKEAEERIEQALKIAPQYAEALTMRGILRMNQNKPTEALSDFDQAIHADPNYATGYLATGAAYNQLGRYDDAERALERGLAIAPNSWQGYFEMGRSLLGKSDFAAALRSINKAEQRMQHEFAPLHLVKAHALLGLKSFREAVTELELYIRQVPAGQTSAEARETLDKARAFAATSK